ncbi:MAG: WGR domain-containing protein [Gammaproteobacteria bacterium]|nr:WGR domain-containing protein [Gammaproteobacteria bacterium]
MNPYTTEQWRASRWETSSRYYEAHVQQGLWGEWQVVRIWGGKGSRRGGMEAEVYASREEACARVTEIARRRRQRGYERAA